MPDIKAAPHNGTLLRFISCTPNQSKPTAPPSACLAAIMPNV